MSEDNTTTEDAVPETEAIAAVVVVRQRSEDGSISAVPMIQGDLDPLAVQTLLEKGIQAWRASIGLPPN